MDIIDKELIDPVVEPDSEKIHRVARSALSIVPLVGGALVETLNALIEQPMVKRRTEWMVQVTEAINKLYERGASSAEQAWSEFTSITSICLTSDFILHERDNESRTLHKLASGPPDIYRIKSRSRNEAYGFILASLMAEIAFNERCMVVKSQQSWDLLASSKQSLLLIPSGFIPFGLGVAVSNGHTVLLAVDEKDTQQAAIKLNHQARLIRQAGIQKMGFDEMLASKLYQETKGYFEPMLRHQLMQPIDYISPRWPEYIPAAVLFATFFATEWSEDNENDKKVLASLSGLTYSEFEKNVIELSKAEDPPIRLVGNIWQVISKIDYWLLVAPRISKLYIDRLGESVTEVLADLDPSYDLPPDERYMANVKGAIPRYSNRLKIGLADSMALLAEYGDEFADQLGGDKPSTRISYWVRQLFEKNTDSRFWFSLNSCMQLVAEAAPEEFLTAVEDASRGDNPPLLGLFKAEGDGIFGGCYHSNLLWALELISWNKTYFANVSLILARLSEIDPGGKWSNRPFNSLVNIYLGWINNTAATHGERIKILDRLIIPQHADIAWKLMVSLLINNTHSSSEICKPEYHEWSKDIERGTTQKSYYEYVEAIVNLLCREVDKNLGERMCDLVGNFDSYNELQQQTIIERLLSVDINEIGENARNKILDKLRNTLSHHREFPEAHWSWSKKLLDRLEEVYHHFDHKDMVKANRYLFDDHWPKMIEPIMRKEVNYDEREELVAGKRISTVEALYAKYSIGGVENLIHECAYPGLVGYAVCNSSISEELLPTALSWLGVGDKHGNFADSYVIALARKDEERAIKLLKENNAWPSAKKAKFLLCLPLSSNTFALVEELPLEGKTAYWSGMYHYFVSGKDTELVPYIASKLLEYNRPLAAVDALAQVLRGRSDTARVNSDLVASILIRIATDPTDIEQVSIQNVRYDILEAVKFIQDAGALKEEDIRQIEWAYLKMFRFEGVTPRYLSKAVAEDPSFFAQLVIWVFKRNDNGEDAVEGLSEDQTKLRAEIAWELLDTISILPGSEGNDIDENRLNEWIGQARGILKDAGREDIGDDRIGAYISRCPVGKDGIWPQEAIRSVIERVRSKCLDDAINCGKRNSRGVTSRHPYAGGDQERNLAQKYFDDAEAIQLTSPRTASILRSIAKSYKWDAEWEDRSVELRD